MYLSAINHYVEVFSASCNKKPSTPSSGLAPMGAKKADMDTVTISSMARSLSKESIMSKQDYIDKYGYDLATYALCENSLNVMRSARYACENGTEANIMLYAQVDQQINELICYGHQEGLTMADLAESGFGTLMNMLCYISQNSESDISLNELIDGTEKLMAEYKKLFESRLLMET